MGITQLNQMIGESNQTQNNSNNTENLIEGLAFLFPAYGQRTSLTKDQAFEAIGRLRDSGEFFVLPEDVQYKCGALFLHEHTKQTSSEHIEKYDISNLLADWKSKYEEDK